ncbi:MAG: phage portal protein, partial [Armatimonadetes bacterium]|nr:phage portal protein [Armatimonadota bacterium]
GYALKIRNKQLKVIQLWFVPHWCIEPHAPENGEGYIDYYEYTPGRMMGRGVGVPIKVPPEDVIHLRNGLDPENIRKGLAPLNILLREIFTDDEAATFTAMLLKNGGVPGAVISPADANARLGEDAGKTKDYIKQQFSGLRRGEPLVMSGPTKIDYFGLDPAKLDLSRLRDVAEERVSSLIGIPAAVVGFGTGLQQTKVGATMAEMRAMAYEDCIIPMQRIWGDEWDLQLLPEFEEKPELFRMVFDLSGVRVLRDDEGKLSDRLTRQLTAGGIELFEYREKLGYDARPEHHVIYLPMGLTVVPAAQIATMGEAPAEPVPPALIPPKAGAIPELKVRASRQVAQLMRATARDWERLSKQWTGALSRDFKSLGDQAGEKFLDYARERGLKADPLEDFDGVAEILMGLLKYEGVDFVPHFLAVAKSVFENIESIMGLGVNLSDPVEQRIITLGGTRKLQLGLDKQAKDSIAEALRQGRELGEGADELASRIVDMVGKGPWATAETRAMVVARTETKYAQNASSLEAYKSGENITGVLVFDAQLGPTDAECEARNQRVVTFAVGERMVESEHPMGTISLAPYVGELPDDADQEKGADVPKVKYSDDGNGHHPSPVNIVVNADGKVQHIPSRRHVTIKRDGKGQMIGA